MPDILPTGKLPAGLLARLLALNTVQDPRVLLGPGLGLDCAVIDNGDTLLVLKSDPITFASEEIGWYLVQVNANDIATTGAQPRWLLVTLLLPEGRATAPGVEAIGEQLLRACRQVGATLIGGHTEVTHGLDRPILAGTMVGEVRRDALVTPRGARPGDSILLTKGVPIEATAILARELPDRLAAALTPVEIEQARGFLFDPGISILRDAQLALGAGRVTAMHDPTEGGLAGALWELAEASGHSLFIDPADVPVPPLSRRICRLLGIDPLEAIASGALLLTAPSEDAALICAALQAASIPCAEIGHVEAGPPAVWRNPPVQRETEKRRIPLPRPARDAIARLFEE